MRAARLSGQGSGWGWTLPVVLGVLVGPAPAGAAELRLEEPAACIGAEELSFRVERLLGMPLANVEVMQLTARIEATTRGFAARLEVSRADSGEPGTRSLEAASCSELAEALALAIVVAIGAETGPSEPPPAGPAPAGPALPASVDARGPAPVDTAGAAPIAARARASEPGPRLAGSAWLLADTGTLPSPGLGVALGVAVAWPSVALRAFGTFLPEQEGHVAAGGANPPGASIGLVAGSALACVPFAVNQATLGLAACAGWELGQLSGSGTHVSVPYDQRRLWSAARIDLSGRWAIARTALAVELLVTAAAPFTRDDFIIKDIGSVHRPANVAGRLGLGLSVSSE